MQLKKYWYYALFLLLFGLFCYFRLKPILLQTVPYTFDQGRDFLRVQSIVRDKDIAVFGPPAGGLNGLSHGVWWYYELLLPYFLGGANPIAFSYYIFFVNALAVVLFAYFLKKHFNAVTSLFFMAILAGSPYFIFSSSFAINSVMTIPFILLLYFSLFMYAKRESPKYIFLLALSAGFIFEAEVPFGLFLFPGLLITLLITKILPTFFSSRKKLVALFTGLVFPFIPRLLAELVSKFRQTIALLTYFANPAEPVDKNANLFLERTKLFWEYFLSIFPEKNTILAGIIIAVTIIGFYSARRLKNKSVMLLLWFSLLLPVSIFFLSQLSEKQLFWANYFEGIQYMLIIPTLIAVYFLSVSHNKGYRVFSSGLLILFTLTSLMLLVNDGENSKKVPEEGLRRHVTIIDTLRKLSNNKVICLRIYTPPVIPHTYNYLFDYYERGGYTKPVNDYINHECFYIFEKDEKGYEFRTKEWRKQNIPATAKKILTKPVTNEVYIERWQEQEVK